MRAIYSIEGNIGSGKSTFLNLLKTHVPQIQVIPQPVAQWQKVSNRFNLLQEYYKDPHRWAFTFQINAILSRMNQLKKLLDKLELQNTHNPYTSPSTSTSSLNNNNTKVYFSQRSIVADREIFAKLLYQQNKMNQMQHVLYLQMFQSLQKLFKTPRIHRFIYLRSSPQRCMQRMIKRARSQQHGILLEYLTHIHRLHEEWLGGNGSVMVVEGDEEFQTNSTRAKEMVRSVKKFLEI